ncbi:hypothetical protein TGME49_240365 [Toxoplasma gondii ME49]|uniref:Uncharacterized protein n=2 Tax=Toxoplasma gondii TaxID=5811 RepID=A0A125YL35_TOXGV|nr:hypothetical protein TGME49_240365 [Toxoplasma gondii ME49]EPT30714.1 hypothetical protein TGME49_240365 [Toxoplasma gondii ME49]ESS31460.1 hypothetical protein TGVEG_240365 [Toxoplasma gondii VEG]|eukprot:XP_018637626.1 hypothetical protein TGME49_240365 [Toxoplasma gondii ME49]
MSRIVWQRTSFSYYVRSRMSIIDAVLPHQLETQFSSCGLTGHLRMLSMCRLQGSQERSILCLPRCCLALEVFVSSESIASLKVMLYTRSGILAFMFSYTPVTSCLRPSSLSRTSFTYGLIGKRQVRLHRIRLTCRLTEHSLLQRCVEYEQVFLCSRELPVTLTTGIPPQRAIIICARFV